MGENTPGLRSDLHVPHEFAWGRPSIRLGDVLRCWKLESMHEATVVVVLNWNKAGWGQQSLSKNMMKMTAGHFPFEHLLFPS